MTWERGRAGIRAEYAYFPRKRELIFILSNLNYSYLHDIRKSFLVNSFCYHADSMVPSVISAILLRYFHAKSRIMYTIAFFVALLYTIYIIVYNIIETINIRWYTYFAVFTVAYALAHVLLTALPSYIRSLSLPFAPLIFRLFGNERLLRMLNKYLMVINKSH